MKRLDLVVGPNGAGKTTFVTKVLTPELPDSLFVNADIIAARTWPDDPMTHSYDAAVVAAQLRQTCLQRGLSFIAETVFSHASKLDLLTDGRAHGFNITLHVVMIPEDLAVERVAHRVAAGGHDVPEVKIRERWNRLWPNVVGAAQQADDTTFWDNSAVTGPVVVGHLVGGAPAGPISWPGWTHAAVTSAWP